MMNTFGSENIHYFFMGENIMNTPTPIVSSEEIYLAEALQEHGTKILFHRETGEVITVESSLSLRGFDEYIYYGTASGDFSYSEWGISLDDGQYVLREYFSEKIGSFASEVDALEAAVETFGLPAEIHDEIQDAVSLRIKENDEDEKVGGNDEKQTTDEK